MQAPTASKISKVELIRRITKAGMYNCAVAAQEQLQSVPARLDVPHRALVILIYSNIYIILYIYSIALVDGIESMSHLAQ